ncbi:MAG: hypothetical protein AAF958_09770 [Planctomycetota bacterium]
MLAETLTNTLRVNLFGRDDDEEDDGDWMRRRRHEAEQERRRQIAEIQFERFENFYGSDSEQARKLRSGTLGFEDEDPMDRTDRLRSEFLE